MSFERVQLGESVTLYRGDVRDVLPTLDPASIDACVTDPPYAEIDRPYGRLTEPEWHALMDFVVPQVRRVLTLKGSAVFVLQPNSERVGRMRPWLWEFMAKWTREWGMVQDAWWWRVAGAAPTVHCQRKYGLMRPSLKACVWLGEADCYRDQDGVLWTESDTAKAVNRADRALRKMPSGQSMRRGRCASVADERGGVTPFNVLPIAAGESDCAGDHGHGAGTPHELCGWWLRYICPPGGVVLDPFVGSGTVALAAIKQGKRAIGIERDPGYFKTARERIEAALSTQVQPTEAA